MAIDLGNYNDVASRIAEFRAKYPDGSLQPVNPAEPYRVEHMGERCYIVVVAAAYRTPDDPRPGIGMAWEQWPGKTNYTRDSELQNAETSAWGRALVAVLAADTKRGVASAEEVRNRDADRTPPAWDPIEQETLYNAYAAAIDDVVDLDALMAVGRQIHHAKQSREISPTTFQKLVNHGAARRAAINGTDESSPEGAS